MIYDAHTDSSHSGQSGLKYSKVVSVPAHVFSFIFHPLFISSYIIAFLIFLHPAAFTGFDSNVKVLRFLTVLFSTLVFPAFAIFICWRLKLIPSLLLATAKDRIIPYIIVMFFYWWTFYVFKNLTDSPPLAVHFLLGSFLAICGGWMCNIFFKISMHAIAMGGLAMFAILFAFGDNYGSGLYLSIAILVAGIVCTARFIVSNHSSFEIYMGFLVGVLAQYIAWIFPLN